MKLFGTDNKPNTTKIAIALALIVTWITIWASYRHLPYSGDPFTYPDIVSAKAGWPFTVFYYPLPPFGNDIPNQGSAFPFALNAMIYFILAWAIVQLIPGRLISKKLEKLLVCIAFWVTLAGLLHTILLFD